jgi:hypothetical protein
VQLRFLDLHETEISVHDEDSQVKRFSHQAEFPMNVDDPLDEEGAARVLDLAFYLDGLQIIGLDTELHLLFAKVLKYGSRKVCCHLRITHLHLVCEDHFFPSGLGILNQSLLEDLLYCLFLVALLRALSRRAFFLVVFLARRKRVALMRMATWTGFHLIVGHLARFVGASAPRSQ